MKAISASIIVLTAGIVLASASQFQSDERLFIQFVGCGVGLIGLLGWFSSIREKA